MTLELLAYIPLIGGRLVFEILGFKINVNVKVALKNSLTLNKFFQNGLALPV